MTKYHEEIEIVICDCFSVEHQLVMIYDEEYNQVYLTIHLNKFSFFQRVWYLVKYLFGHTSNYGAFDDFIITNENKQKILKVLNKLHQ